MMEAMNGQLKFLVGRFLASEGIFNSETDGGESWLDIVASLSWEAALLVKPGGSEGKEMDPCSYVKVKCIASGTRRQSEVIKGLVFKKNAAHKHMPTKFKNPRLLLLRGVFGHSASGLSSFNSMEQEKGHFEKSIVKMMEMCQPNVVLVEKAVSRDIQEFLLKQGVTLVLDMKLNRLKRIARCTGSPVISFSDVLTNPKLKQCEFFHVERFVEEHNGVGEGAKRPSKTLMFLEGLPKPLGCTILLKGATSEELKKIKNVMQYAVFSAYHLILETLFFVDQRVFLTEMNAVRKEKSVNVKNEALPLRDNALSSKVPNSSMLSTVSEGFTSSCNGFNVLGTQSIDLPVTSSPESIDSRPVANINGDFGSRFHSLRDDDYGENDHEGTIPVSNGMQLDISIQDTKDGLLEKPTDIEVQNDEKVSSDETYPVHSKAAQDLCNAKLEDTENRFWAPFSSLKITYINDIQSGSLEKFHLIDSYTPSHPSPVFQLSTEKFTVCSGGNVLSVSEDEISSIIAFALATEPNKSIENKSIEKSSCVASLASAFWSSMGSVDSETNHSASIASSLSADEVTSFSDSDGLSLLALQGMHPEFFIDTAKTGLKGICSVVCIYAKQFYALREKCCPSELAYISSLSRCKKWDAQGGKSKAFFAKSLDERLIIKQIKKAEFDSFLEFGPDYFKHISDSLEFGSQTCLARILGIYQVKQIKNGKEMKIDLLVMENLFFGHNISRTYDLKGAIFSRHISDSDECGEVLLDQNFIEDMCKSPIYISEKKKRLLQRGIWNDTAFLNRCNVMDYSLLVGVDKERKVLVFGIIDYLGQYTWDKQLESWVKASFVVPKNERPTVISPKEYKKRFRAFMSKYFLSVPDGGSLEVYEKQQEKPIE